MNKGRICITIVLAAVLLLVGCAKIQIDKTKIPTLPKEQIPLPTATKSKFEFGVKYKVLVVKVIDGDTADVKFPDGSVERVRFLGVDTPETKAEKNRLYEYDAITNLTCLAEWGLKAKNFTKSNIEGKYVYIEFDKLAGFRGYYGRLLAYVYYPNETTDFTAELIKRGYARVYEERIFEKKLEYLKYQSHALEKGKGLWEECMAKK